VGDGSTVDHFVYSGGTNGATVELFKVYNGDHDWPGAFGNLDISSNIEIWKFFSRYDINGSTAAVDEQEVGIGLSVSPNPAQSDLKIHRANGETANFSVHSMDGKELMTGILNSTTDSIDLKGFQKGSYLLIVGYCSQKFMIK
jgi:polyhydroxybutyrate depolymerase